MSLISSIKIHVSLGFNCCETVHSVLYLHALQKYVHLKPSLVHLAQKTRQELLSCPALPTSVIALLLRLS